MSTPPSVTSLWCGRLVTALVCWRLVWALLAFLFLGVLLQLSDHLAELARAHSVMAQLQYQGYSADEALRAEALRVMAQQAADTAAAQTTAAGAAGDVHDGPVQPDATTVDEVPHAP